MSTGRISKYNLTVSTEEPKWKCGIYLRLSREDGDKLESDSISNQRKLIDSFLAKNTDIEVYDVYVDDGYTGSNFERPSVSRLIEDIKNRKINCIVVKDLSRFGRNYYETGRYLEVVFPLLQVRFIAVNDYIDSFKNPQSAQNACVSFRNVINDEYCKDISRKVRSSFDAKRKRGDYIGSFALYGYEKDPEDRHRLIIDQDAAENVKLIYRLFLSGLSIYNITLKLNRLGIPNPTAYRTERGLKSTAKLTHSNPDWSTRTIRRILTNEMYIGNMVQGTCRKVSPKVKKCVTIPKEHYIVVKGTHEPIIDKESFEKVQARFKRDSWQPKGNEPYQNGAENGSIFVGFMQCPDCGRAMQRTGGMQGKNPLYYFVCGSYHQWKICTRHAIRVQKLYEIVLKTIQTYISIAVEADKVLAAIDAKPKEECSSRIKRELAACNMQLEKAIRFQNDLYIDYKNELITKEQYLHFKEDSANKIKELEARRDALTDELTDAPESGNNEFVETFKRYQNITCLSREMIEVLIDMIYVHKDGKVHIKFKFADEFQRALDLLNEHQEEYHTKIISPDQIRDGAVEVFA